MDHLTIKAILYDHHGNQIDVPGIYDERCKDELMECFLCAGKLGFSVTLDIEVYGTVEEEE